MKITKQMTDGGPPKNTQVKHLTPYLKGCDKFGD